MVMRPGEQQLWRLLNASLVTYLNLALTTTPSRCACRSFGPKWLGVVAIDKVLMSANGSPTHGIQ